MIELTGWLRRELVNRALSEAPHECCGLVSQGKDGRVALWAAENASERPWDAFLISAEDQFAILRAMGKHGHKLAGIYHSHPSSSPAPSRSDRLFAEGWPGVTWLIVGLGGSTEPDDAEFWAGLLP